MCAATRFGDKLRASKAWIFAVTLIALPPIAQANTDTYGRVFFTPRDRVLLDDARRRKVSNVAKPVTQRRVAIAAPQAEEPPPPPRPSGNVTLNGIVRRSDGESTIWVNGVAMPADAQTGKVQVAPTTSQSGVIAIPNADSGGRVELKVGQKLDLSSGNVSERYANRPSPRALPSERRTPAATPKRRPRTEDPEE
ncbi:MAG: hypothetical protein FJY37_05800 [Betaproteobacteria bacterium]|nr:hypothetical protein [Betaproteobacteria bacterium]